MSDNYEEVTWSVIFNGLLSIAAYLYACYLFVSHQYDMAACMGVASVCLRQASDHTEIKNLLKMRNK